MGRNIKKSGAGFTLMEVLIVMGIVGIFMAASLFMDMSSYRGDAFRSEEDSLATSLQTARADALNNINQQKHGVAIHPGGYDGYVIFEGETYATRDVSHDEDIKASYNVTFSPATPSEVVFEQLSGNIISGAGDITLMDSSRNMTATISTNYEGKISW